MDFEIKVTVKKNDLVPTLRDYFEGDVRETLKTLFYEQGIHYKEIDFEFDYKNDKEEK